MMTNDDTNADLTALIADACRHCGAPPESDGDHTCPCPNPDGACPQHDPTPVAEAIAAWEAKGPTSHTVALLADALYGARGAVERLTRERDDARAAGDVLGEHGFKMIERAEAAEAEVADLRTRLANVRHEVETYREAMPAFWAIYSDHRDVLTKEAQRRAHLALTYPRTPLDGPQDGGEGR